jgi:hypothetical protein
MTEVIKGNAISPQQKGEAKKKGWLFGIHLK